MCFPGRLPVVEVVLGHVCDHALIVAARQNKSLGFSIRESQSRVSHRLSDQVLRLLNLHALARANEHRTSIESLLIRNFLRFRKLLNVLLRVNLQLLYERRGSEVTICRSVDNWDGVNRAPFGLNLVELGLLLKVCQSCEIVWRVRGDRSDNAGTLDSNQLIWKRNTENSWHTYLVRLHAFHREDINLRDDTKRCLYFCAHNLGTVNFEQLGHLAFLRQNILECHIPGGAVGAYIRLVILGRENSVLDGGANEAVRLTIP